MDNRHGIDEDLGDGPRLIKKETAREPIRYSQRRHRILLFAISIFIAFLLGLVIMPSKLKRDALQQQKTIAVEKQRPSSTEYSHDKEAPQKR